jgi:fatty acid desaturase
MLDSVQDRTFISGVTGTHTWDKNGKLKVNIEFKKSPLQFFLTLTNYGHHVLHHLFPTIDHYYLPKLYPILQETLQDFGEVYITSSVTEQIKGQFQQLLRIKPNLVPPGPRKHKE